MQFALAAFGKYSNKTRGKRDMVSPTAPTSLPFSREWNMESEASLRNDWQLYGLVGVGDNDNSSSTLHLRWNEI